MPIVLDANLLSGIIQRGHGDHLMLEARSRSWASRSSSRVSSSLYPCRPLTPESLSISSAVRLRSFVHRQGEEEVSGEQGEEEGRRVRVRCRFHAPARHLQSIPAPDPSESHCTGTCKAFVSSGAKLQSLSSIWLP